MITQLAPAGIGSRRAEYSIKVVANLWTEFTAQRCDSLTKDGKEPQNPNKLAVAATFEMAKT